MKKPNVFRRFLRPEVILILLAAVYAAAALFPSDPQDAFEFHLHDTYYVIARPHMYLFMAGSIALTAIVYFLTRNFRQWTILQYVYIICIVAFQIIHFLPIKLDRTWEDTVYYERLWGTMYLLFLLGNLVFLVNLIAGFIRGKKTTAS